MFCVQLLPKDWNVIKSVDPVCHSAAKGAIALPQFVAKVTQTPNAQKPSLWKDRSRRSKSVWILRQTRTDYDILTPKDALCNITADTGRNEQVPSLNSKARSFIFYTKITRLFYMGLWSNRIHRKSSGSDVPHDHVLQRLFSYHLEEKIALF